MAWVHDECPDYAPLPSHTQYRQSEPVTLGFGQSPVHAEPDDIPSAIVPAPREFVPSKYQLDIFDFVSTGDGNAVVEAVAGSGKTTTEEKALDYTPKDKSVVYLAFNKRIVDEAKSRMPAHCKVATTHSQAFSNVRRHYGRVTVDDRKTYHIIDELQADAPWGQAEMIADNAPAIRQLVSLCKNTLVDNWAGLDFLCDRFGIDLNGSQPDIYETVLKVLHVSRTQTGTIDFDDMLWYCATGQVNSEQHDYMFIDEAQDLNKAQLEFIKRSTKPDGRIIAVGDRSQSIYGFRGADTDAIPNLIEATDATLLPLSICYRCPKSHVELAQSIVPQIEWRENALDGVIGNLFEDELINHVKPGDMAICRVNAPLVKPAFELIRQGVKAVIIGRDIGQGLVTLIAKVSKKHNADTVIQLISALYDYSEREISKLMQAHKNQQAATLSDQVDTIIALCEGADTIQQVKDKIASVFKDEVQGVAFSSVHRAKGLEAERVFIIRPELMPHKLAVQPWQQIQESNIRYISLTRSKSELYFVAGD
jgi:DNA helicase-2/ATP-dependent DNA helicase PcrA